MSGPPLVPYRPEPLAALRARFPRALACVFDLEKLGTPGFVRPGEVPACVFDCEDGLRLVVSLEDLGPPAGVQAHFSASVRPASPAEHRVLVQILRDGPETAIGDFRTGAEARYRDISGFAGSLEFAGLSQGKGVPHWFHQPDRARGS